MMDFKRLILAVVFAFSVIMLWERWVQYTTPPAVPEAAQSATVDASIPSPMASGAAASASVALPGAVASGYADAPRAVVEAQVGAMRRG